MRLKRSTYLALHILAIMSSYPEGTLVGMLEISESVGVARQKMFKVMTLLTRAGILLGIRGPGGGMKLTTSPFEIRLGDVVLLMELGAGQRDAMGKVGKDQFERIVDGARAASVAALNQHTVASLAGFAQRPRQVEGVPNELLVRYRRRAEQQRSTGS